MRWTDKVLSLFVLNRNYSKQKSGFELAEDTEARGMINKKDYPVDWALLLYGLEDAREHIEDLMTDMQQDDNFCEMDLDIQLSHIYQHLNRVWNSRNMSSKLALKKFDEISKFPKDLTIL